MKEWKKQALELAITTNLSWRKIAKELGVPKSSVSDFLRHTLKQGSLHEVVDKENKPKLLHIDIETSMMLAYVWGLWKQNISLPQIVEDWYIICFSASWEGEDEIINGSVHDWEKNPRYKDNEILLVEKIWGLLDEADAICAYNGIKFDKKKVNAKFWEYGLPEPSPYKIIDPYQTVKHNFALTSNKMDYVTKMQGNEGKIHTNIQLWIDCMADIESALDDMQTYCAGDIRELKQVYNDTKHWDKRHPNMALYYDDNKKRCNACGSDSLTKLDSKAHTYVSSFTVYRCENCKKILRDRASTVDKDKRKNLVMNVQ